MRASWHGATVQCRVAKQVVGLEVGVKRSQAQAGRQAGRGRAGPGEVIQRGVAGGPPVRDGLGEPVAGRCGGDKHDERELSSCLLRAKTWG